MELALLDWGGEGPLALLHHANGFCAAVWAPVAEHLRTRFRVIAYDARGHGDSTQPHDRDAYLWKNFPEDLTALAEALLREGPWPSVALGAGHSFGGTSIAVAAARRPELFERIALLDPVLPPPPDALAPPPAALAGRSPNFMAEGARRRRHLWPSAQAVLEAWSRSGHPFSTWDRRSLELYVREGFRARGDGQLELKCPGEIEATIYERNGTMDPHSSAPLVRVPALVVRGARSHFPRELIERFARAIPLGRFEEVDAGHLLVMEAPEAVAERLLAFACEQEMRPTAAG